VAEPRATRPLRHHGIVAARAMTLRLDDGLAEDLATVAAVDGRPVSEVVRQAVADHVRARKADPRFRAALREHIGKARRLLGEDEAA
jgi:predicted transcriptional regulator